MRTAAFVTTLVLALSLFGTAQAAHTAQTADQIDPFQAVDEDGRVLDADLPFDLLVLPEELRSQARAQMSASLPGPNAELSLDLALLDQRASVFTVHDYLSQPSLDLADQTSPSTVSPSSGTLVEAETADLPTSATSTDASTHQTSSDTSEPASDAGEDEATVETQSNAAHGPSTMEEAKQAWADLSPAQKTAVGAGILSLLLLGPLTMYSRIKRDDALENDTRREIYEIVEANPGVCIKDVADEADVSYSTASYHLDRLLKMDYVARREEGNRVLYYKNGGTFNNEERELVPILKNTEAMRVFQHILENPWCYRAEVAEALGVSHTTVNWHLKRLAEADLVEEHREGRSCHLHIPDEALDRVVDVLDKLEEMGVDEEYAQVAGPVPA